MHSDCISEDQDQMAFSRENESWVKKQVDEAIAAAISPPNRVIQRLKDAGLITTLFAVPLALIGICVTLGLKVSTDIRDETAFRTRTELHFKSVEASLKDLGHPSQLGSKSESLELSFRALASMQQPQFDQNLIKVAETIAVAKKQGKVSDIAILDAIQKKLSASPLATPEGIQAASAVINYASFVREKNGLFSDADAARSKDCGLIDLNGGKGRMDKTVITLDGGSADMIGCNVRLDGLDISNYTFVNALIIYDGGAVRLRNVSFSNCLFMVSGPVHPAAPAVKLFSAILKNNLGIKPAFTTTII